MIGGLTALGGVASGRCREGNGTEKGNLRTEVGGGTGSSARRLRLNATFESRKGGFKIRSVKTCYDAERPGDQKIWKNIYCLKGDN